MTDPVLLSIDGNVATVTLNRPDKRNAVNGAVAAALDAIVKQTEADDTVRVVVLASSHPTTFCAGADLAEIAAGNAAALSTPDGGFAGLTDHAHAKPWIAAVAGNALAGGCELALSCDLIVASETARFGLPEVKRGLFAGAGGVHRLPRAVPRNIGIEMVITGEPIDGRRAYDIGLVNRLVAANDVLSTAQALAATIAANAPLAVRESLAVARLANEHTDADLRELSHKASIRTVTSEDAIEGSRAFLEKRAPVWKGK